MNDMLNGSTVLITGGTGTFGSAFLSKCLASNAKEVRIFSRDEKKQYDMAQKYRYTNSVTFYLGDVRDRSTVDAAMKGVDYVFHAAAMKQVPSCENFPMEAVKTNIQGSLNVIEAAIANNVKKIVCLSTDKAVYPTSAMGMSKAYMERIAFSKAKERSGTKICVTRFGNLVASRGSAIPLFVEQAKRGLPITITDPAMTRFVMTVDDAVDLVKWAFENGNNGDLLIKRTAACSTGDMADAAIRILELSEDYPVEVIGKRPGEKMHEALLTDEEAECAEMLGGIIKVPLEKTRGAGIGIPYKSNLAEQLGVREVLRMVKQNRYGTEEMK